MTSLQDRTRFEPSEVEPRIVERWLASGLHHPEPEGTAAENYSIAIPPPNVTGVLHMGHALNGSIQDCLIRYQRMHGRRAKWILGTDHAGIATQKQVERQLQAEGTSREEIGREAFVARVWEWREQYGGSIIEQFKRLGATVDYDDERFTLDDAYVRAVMKVFVDLYDKDLIYRDHYLVNWDPGSRSAISDLEVEDREVTDTLFHIAYPLEDALGRDRGRHRAPGDDAGRHRGRGAPRRRALPPPHRQHGGAAPRRAPPDDHRRRVRQARLRHRRAEDHARPRPQRLRDRPPPRPRRDQRHRRGRAHDGRGGHRLRGLHRAGGAREGRRGADRAGADPPPRALHPHRALQPPLGRAHRAADLAAVVHGHGRAGPARDRGRRGRARAHPSRVAVAPLPGVAAQHPPLVHLAPAVVGPPDPGLVSRGRGDLRRPRAARGRGLGARSRRARHVVLLRAVAVRDAGLARGDARADRLLPDRRALHGARHPLPVGRADGDDGARVHRRDSLRRRLRALGHPGARRPADEQVAGDRHRPDRRDRRPRRRRGSLRAAGDVEHPGRPLLLREGPPGPGAGQQALQRRPLRARQRRRLDRARAAPHDGPRPLDPQPPAGGQGAVRREPRRLRLLQGRARALRLRLRRAVRLVPGVQQRPRIRRRALGHDAPRPARDAAARPSDHPLRHRGAVVTRARHRAACWPPSRPPRPTTACATPTPRRASTPSSPP